MKRVEFHNTRWLDKLRNHLTKNRFGDWSTQSTDLYKYFLKMTKPSVYEQLEGVKIDKYDMYSGCIVFYDDAHKNQVIVHSMTPM